jgi:hypothetical protein
MTIAELGRLGKLQRAGARRLTLLCDCSFPLRREMACDTWAVCIDNIDTGQITPKQCLLGIATSPQIRQQFVRS